jgi:hypothetical protein
MLHAKYLSSGHYSFTKEDINAFSYKVYKQSDHWDGVNFDPRGMIFITFVENHETMLNAKYLSLGFGLSEMKISNTFPFQY